MRRAARTGIGPTHDAPAPNPGAVGAFALLGEVLLVGVVVVGFGFTVLTLPAALAAGIRHVRRFVRAEGSPFRALWADFLKALPAGLLVGAATALLGGVLALDIVVARSGAMPGGPVIEALGWVIAAAAAGGLLLVCAAWTSEAGWRAAFRAAPTAVAADPIGALYAVVAACFVGLAGWMLLPLAIPAAGCAALAAVAAPARRRGRSTA